MMRWIKIALLFLGGIILLCMLLLAIVLATFDNDDYERLLTRAVMKYSGYQLIIEGPFSLNLSTEPSLSASKIRLEDVSDKTLPPITHIGKFEIKVALLPLLFRTVLIKYLLIDDVIFSASHGKGTTLRANGELVLGDNLFSPEVKKVDLKLQLTAQDTKPLKTFLFDWLPDTGPVTGNARLIGPVEQLVLENLDITAGESNTVRINAKGRLGRIPINLDSQVSGVDISLSIESEQPSLLFTGLDVSIPELDSVSARARVHGNGDNLLFDEIKVRMTDPGGVTTEVSGSIGLKQRENKAPLGRFNLDVNMTALSLKSFRRLLAAKILPDLGPVHASTHVTGTTEIMVMENIVLKAGYPGPVRFEVSGRIGKIVFEGEQPLSEVDLVSHTYAEKSSDLSPLIGIVLPDLGPMEVRSRIVSRKDGYGVDDMEYFIGNKDNILVKGRGSVEYLMRKGSVAMEGINQFWEILDLDVQAFSGFLGQRFSGLGKLKGSFSVSGSMNDLSVSDADLLMTSPEGLKISARGDIKHIRPEEDNPFQQIIMELSATAPDMTAIQKLTDLDFPDLGPVSMSASVNDRDGSLNIEMLQIRTGPEKMPTLLVEGQMHDILNTEQMDFSVSFEAATRPWLEKFYGHSVPEEHRLKGKVSLSGSTDHFDIEGTATSGKTNIKTAIEVSRVNERRRVVANVSAPKIYLDDFGIYPEAGEKKETAKKDKKIRREKIFSDEPYLFPELNDLDLSFRLDTEEVIGIGFILNDLNIDIELNDGLMLIGPARVTYADGFVSLESTLDMRGSEPGMKLNLKAEDIDIADLFSYAHSPMILGGHLNLSIDLQSSGDSPRSLASTLNGELGISIEHGQIKRTADLLGADAIDFLTTSGKLGTYQKLNCLALNFEFNDGIGNSQVIYIDSPGVRSRGKGTVNLREETVDFVIQPKPKKGQLGGSSAVTIKGPLSRPSVSKLPFKEAARLYGEIFTPYVFLPARALGYVWYLMQSDKDEESPCFSQDNLN
jgi:hypothetical protein